MSKVVKFGGSSLASAEQFQKVGNIIRADKDRRYVVPSAPGKRNSKDTKVTDMLYGCYALAEAGKSFDKELKQIKERYQEIINGLGLEAGLLDNEFETIKVKFAEKAGVDYAASRGEYQYSSAARRLQVVPNEQQRPVKKVSHATRKNRERALHMNIGYVLFLVTAMVAAGVILTGYLKLQSDITNSIKNISVLESQLNTLKLDNDETYSRISSNVNLEEVRRIAIQELGMKYADEGQIIIFDGEDSDYVRQTGEIPK